MPNFFLPASDLERSMKAICHIDRQLPVTAKVLLFCILHAFCSRFRNDCDCFLELIFNNTLQLKKLCIFFISWPLITQAD